MYQAVHLEVGSEVDINILSRKIGTRAGSGEEKLLLLAERPPVAPICRMLYIGKCRLHSCARFMHGPLSSWRMETELFGG